MNKKPLYLVTARGGSKGLPNKNIKKLNGKPLLCWTLEQALCCTVAGRIIVSTDSPEIATVAEQFGVPVPFLRPPELATDRALHVDVILHTLRWLQDAEDWLPDSIILLQPTCPFRTSLDIENCYRQLYESAVPAVISVTESETHPSDVQKMDADGILEDFLEQQIFYPRRQDLPVAYRMNGAIYAIKTKAFLESKTLFPVGTGGYLMPKERSLDIDTPWDFHLAELLTANAFKNA